MIPLKDQHSKISHWLFLIVGKSLFLSLSKGDLVQNKIEETVWKILLLHLL